MKVRKKPVFVAPNGKLYYESLYFHKACHEVVGVSVTELWCDTYDMHDPYEDLIIPADTWPYEYDGHPEGGVRIDIDYDVNFEL